MTRTLPSLDTRYPVTLTLLQWSIVRAAMVDAVNVNHTRGFHNTARSTLAVYDAVCTQTEEALTEACREPADEEVA
jgi:hypothetical protein